MWKHKTANRKACNGSLYLPTKKIRRADGNLSSNSKKKEREKALASCMVVRWGFVEELIEVVGEETSSSSELDSAKASFPIFCFKKMA
jgi:hypothetical protein